jgi:hypothetical protein
MPLVNEGDRLDALRRLGLSPAVVELARGRNQGTAFWFHCAEPYMPFAEGARNPEGPKLVPLWACGDTVTAGRERDGRLEFIEYSMEAPEEYEVIAHTEQGLLATLFISMYEGQQGEDEQSLAAAATSAGFRYFREMVEAYTGSRHNAFESHAEFVRAFTARIDEWVSRLG